MSSASYFGSMHAIENLAEIIGKGHQHLGAFSSHGHETNGGLWICCCLVFEDHVDGI